MIASTTPVTYNARKINAQTVKNRLQEIGERPPYTMYIFYMQHFFLGLVYVQIQENLSSGFWDNVRLKLACSATETS